MANGFKWVQTIRNQVLINEWDPVKYIYFVQSGEYEVLKQVWTN